MNSKVLSKGKDFDELFTGEFDELRLITYVTDPEVLMRYIEKGFKKVIAIIGEKLSRDSLSKKDIHIIERLVEMTENGKLQIYTPNGSPIHSKLYILSGRGHTRVINGSMNLLESRSTNYVWYDDLPSNDPFVKQNIGDFQKHLKRCTLFMSDLIELFHREPKTERHQLISVWLRGEPADKTEIEVRGVLQEATFRSLEPESDEAKVFAIELPESEKARKRVENIIRHFKPLRKGNDLLELNAEHYRRLVKEIINVPLMVVDLGDSEVRMGIEGPIKSLTGPSLADPLEVNQSLKHIEDFIDMALHYGQTTDPNCVRASYYEIILYLLSSPFFHEWMRIKQEKQSLVDPRGPRFLYVYGPGYNGKSILLQFALKLLTMENIKLIKNEFFKKEKINEIREWGTIFPLVFDDVNPGTRHSAFENIVKGNWEQDWRPDNVQSQVVISSNYNMTKSWAVPRIKKVLLDIHFRQKRGDRDTDEGKEKAHELIAHENPIFKSFSILYFKELDSFRTNDRTLSSDELCLARNVMQQLYRHAGRSLPEWFPWKPVEDLYDPNRGKLQELLDYHKLKIREDNGVACLDFADDVDKREIRNAINFIPTRFDKKEIGNTALIDPEEEFWEWLGRRPSNSGILSRLFKRKR